MPKRSYECEYPPCHNVGIQRAINPLGQARRRSLNLCDMHYEKLRKNDPELTTWLASIVWP